MKKSSVAWIMSFACICASLVGCGLQTPDKDLFADNSPKPDKTSAGGLYENDIVNHIACEISAGLTQAQKLDLPWLNEWGTTVTQTITVSDQSGVSPGINVITPLKNEVFKFLTGGNVISPQSFALSFGVTASVNATRTETIQYTFKNSALLEFYPPTLCAQPRNGVLIDGDLKIREFIYDKAVVAALGNPSLKEGGLDHARSGRKLRPEQIPPFNTFTEQITFVSAFGGSFTPTWKLARISSGTGANLLVGERTNVNDLVITLGAVDEKTSKFGPIVLNKEAMNQHNTRVQASAIAVSSQSLAR